jgi:thymidylate synthase
MKQYLDLLKEIKSKGTYKSAARENMPGTQSLFGYQLRHNLSDGFPLLTTKKIKFEHIITELLWFLRGDTNIKYLVDNGCNIWNEDAYNYYLKICKEEGQIELYSFKQFVDIIKSNNLLIGKVNNRLPSKESYKLGDCGKQYGWLWRNFGEVLDGDGQIYNSGIDQIQILIEGLKSNPMSRRHVVTAWNPATLDDMALNACHCLVQFNCRPISVKNQNLFKADNSDKGWTVNQNRPKYYLDCQMYQRSADVFLGVPYNIASYALLTEMLSKICNMIPGEFIHTFGDVHIYDNHERQVDLQLTRTPSKLPELDFRYDFLSMVDDYQNDKFDLKDLLNGISPELIGIKNYIAQSTIKGKLSTGLK